MHIQVQAHKRIKDKIENNQGSPISTPINRASASIRFIRQRSCTARPTQPPGGETNPTEQVGNENFGDGGRRATFTCRAPRRRGRWRCGCRSRGWRRGASATTCRRTWGRSRPCGGRARSSARASSGRSSSCPSPPRPPAPPPARRWVPSEVVVGRGRLGFRPRRSLGGEAKEGREEEETMFSLRFLFLCNRMVWFGPHRFKLSRVWASPILIYFWCLPLFSSLCPTGCHGLDYIRLT